MKLTIVAAVLIVAGIPAAFAQPDWPRAAHSGNVRSVTVYTGDLNLSDPGDRDEAAWRIEHAAHLACAPFPDVRVLQEVRDYRGCQADAFDEAIDELEWRAAHAHRRGHVTTREYPPGEAPPESEPGPDGE